MMYDFEHDTPQALLEATLSGYPSLRSCGEDIYRCFELLCVCYEGGGKLLAAGNGGSASDSAHIVGELMKGFMGRRPLPRGEQDAFASMGEEGNVLARKLQGALPALDLTAQAALSTAFANDVAPELVFAQQVYGYGKPGDVFLGLSTSGNSRNVGNAVLAAKARGMRTAAITGESGGRLKALCDVCICVPSGCTPVVQEFTLPVYHTLCMMLEKHFFAPGAEITEE